MDSPDHPEDQASEEDPEAPDRRVHLVPLVRAVSLEVPAHRVYQASPDPREDPAIVDPRDLLEVLVLLDLPDFPAQKDLLVQQV